MPPSKVLYTGYATEALYDAIRRALPPDVHLVTLTADSDEERRAKIVDCAFAIMATMRFPASLIDAAPELALILHFGVGYQDTVDLEAMRRRGIRLTITPEGTVTSVAEHAVMLMLAACRRLPFLDRELCLGRWHSHSMRPVSRELRGKRIGYLGMGRIGQNVAQLLSGFETSGLYHDPLIRLDAARESMLGVRSAAFDEVLRQSDVVTLHLPLSEQTRHIIDDRALRRMRQGVILINTARGGLIDEQALVTHLDSGHVLAAGLDVFENEPYPSGGPLANRPNVIVTPHCGGGTADALAEKLAVIGENIARFRQGVPLLNEIVC